MNNKTKKSPTGAPMGNPLKFFREGGEKIKAMFKKGGYNTPTQSLPKANKGRTIRDIDEYFPEPVRRERGDGSSYNPYTPKPKYGPMTEEAAMLQNSGKPNFSNGPTVMNTPITNLVNPMYTPEEKNGGMMKKGGSTKSKKFAALARPFNKATAADRIAGAKKNARKKK